MTAHRPWRTSPEAVIVAATRSPVGRAFKGSLSGVRPDDLACTVIDAALAKVPELDRSDIDDLLLGCGAPGGYQGFNMARVVAVLLGLDHAGGTTVTRYCASSLQTTRMALHAIRAGEGSVFISAGVEVVSHSRLGTSDSPPVAADVDPRDRSANPWVNRRFAEAQQRTRDRAATGAMDWQDPRQNGLLPDVYMAMGLTAENVARVFGVSRADQDEFACRSQQRAVAARNAGFFDREITPVTTVDGTVTEDDSLRPGTTVEELSALKPVFRPNGTVTAGNCCPLSDGAAALVILSDVKAAQLESPPLARIVSTGVVGLSPELMGMGPVEASHRALALAGLSMDDIDLVEINEAFAGQVIPCARELGVDDGRLNVHGGAIAIGHPFGMTGARLTTTLINGLAKRDKTLGLAAMCVGGGQGMAMIIERLR